ncbi:TetR/AcrR family transcriptional regulator [Pseudonocardia thermophila]|nr:TetR/AcrR family transcriptional regulator [Pseudonocardia thermophila]
MARPSSTRRRDPERRARILEAAARLTAARGFHNVGMAEIGAEAGIVGSGIYRHFASKDEILVVLLEEGMARLQRGTDEVIAAGTDDHTTMSALVRDHITVAIEHRSILAVYHREQQNLPEEARRRLRRAQRHYVEDWVHTLAPLRRDLTDPELRVAVHAAIGAIQSTLFFRSGLPPERLASLLDTMAHGCLGIEPSPSEFQLTQVLSA